MSALPFTAVSPVIARPKRLPNVVALVGTPVASPQSRTLLLARQLLQELQQHLPLEPQLIELGEIARPLGQAIYRNELEPVAEAALQQIEAADLLIVVAPVYRGSYPGLFKHLVDFIGLDALIDTPVLLAASGGSERHALVIDHQLRPLFSFLQAQTLPIGVYASASDYEGDQQTSPVLQARIALAAERAARHLGAKHSPLRQIA